MPRNYLIAVIFSVLSFSVAKADVAFTTFLPGDGYNSSTGYLVSGPNSAFGVNAWGMQFTSSLDGELTSVRFAGQHGSGGSPMQIQLAADDGSDGIGATLETWFFTLFGSTSTIYTLVDNSPGLTLNSGHKYWLTFVDSDLEVDGINADDASVPLGRLAGDGGSGWSYTDNQQLSAFDVNVTPVPEPASILFLSLGALAVWKRKRRA
ncbi:MAG TPA: PEP-CTERM sorting domain-containing protein [Fimbriimonadaceae bacterium]|nr:PEP-CTERM sorting domain-containing protein [Fimbriimonadaceae bacterium]